MPESSYGSYVYVPNSSGGTSRVCPEMVEAIEVAFHLAGLSEKLVYTQGGLNNGAVGASANTHDGLCVSDLRTTNMTDSQLWSVTTWLLRCGVVAFIRGVKDSLTEHLHLVMANPRHAHPDAKAQVTDYKNGRNGLANHAAYYGPDVPFTTWENSRYYGMDEVDMATIADITNAVVAALKKDGVVPNNGFLASGGETVSVVSTLAGLGRKIDDIPTSSQNAERTLKIDGIIANPGSDTNPYIALATAIVSLRTEVARLHTKVDALNKPTV